MPHFPRYGNEQANKNDYTQIDSLPDTWEETRFFVTRTKPIGAFGAFWSAGECLIERKTWFLIPMSGNEKLIAKRCVI